MIQTTTQITLKRHDNDWTIATAATSSDPLIHSTGLIRHSTSLPETGIKRRNPIVYTGCTYSLYDVPDLHKAFPSPEELQEVERKKSLAADLMAHIERVGGLR
jgi:hypothetical protein